MHLSLERCKKPDDVWYMLDSYRALYVDLHMGFLQVDGTVCAVRGHALQAGRHDDGPHVAATIQQGHGPSGRDRQ